MGRNKSIALHWNAHRQTRSHLFYFFAHIPSFSPSLKVPKHPCNTSISAWLFLLHAFHSPLCDVTPVVCQTESRRCLMRPLFIFFPDSFSPAFYFYFIFKWNPPTQCCDTAFLSLGWQCGSQGISLFSSSHVFFTHTHSPFLSTSSIIMPPSGQDTAESRGFQPEPDALECVTSLAQRQRPADRCPPRTPWWSGSEAPGCSGGWEEMKCYFKTKGDYWLIPVWILTQIIWLLWSADSYMSKN